MVQRYTRFISRLFQGNNETYTNADRDRFGDVDEYMISLNCIFMLVNISGNLESNQKLFKKVINERINKDKSLANVQFIGLQIF